MQALQKAPGKLAGSLARWLLGLADGIPCDVFSREKGQGAVNGEARGRDDGAGMVPLCKVGLTGYACLMQRTVPVLGSNSRCKSELLDPDRQDGESCGPQDGSGPGNTEYLRAAVDYTSGTQKTVSEF